MLKVISDPLFRTKEIISRLKKEFPEARTALDFSNPLQLLISTILSAQCTDVRVNMITPILFAKYKSVKAFAQANVQELEQDIRSTGFYRMKAKHILGAAQAIQERFHGEVPKTMEELITLPGVGRKTANCVLGGAFGIRSGIVVDTHVGRLSNRLGLTASDAPEKIEKDLLELVPQKEWYRFSNLIILHGRKTCKARKPLCENCILVDLCPSAFSLTVKNLKKR
jgi:endonuclease III